VGKNARLGCFADKTHGITRVKYTAKLVTDRQLERPVQRFAPDYVNAEGVARECLSSADCAPGDSIEIYETRQVLVATLVLLSEGKIQKKSVDPQ
jgi:hypothetical protein